jgi:hypothetical protein
MRAWSGKWKGNVKTNKDAVTAINEAEKYGMQIAQQIVYPELSNALEQSFIFKLGLKEGKQFRDLQILTEKVGQRIFVESAGAEAVALRQGKARAELYQDLNPFADRGGRKESSPWDSLKIVAYFGAGLLAVYAVTDSINAMANLRHGSK